MVLFELSFKTVVKGLHEADFLPGRGEKFIVVPLDRGHGRSLTLTDSRGVLGSLEKKLQEILLVFSEAINITGYALLLFFQYNELIGLLPESK